MDGKVCLVTGGTSGIGFYTAQQLARMGASVTIIGRNYARCLTSVERIRIETGNSAVNYLLADLSSQSQIRSISDQFLQQHRCLDVLINNAGGAYLFRRISEDGIELTFAVNHLAYFMLTLLLFRALKASYSARVINVSSGSHFGARLDFADLQVQHFYNPYKAYARSKLANILFTYELARRVTGTRITTNALTPGMVATDIWKKINPLLTPLIFPIIKMIAQTSLEGAQTSVYLASSPEVEGITGKYFVNKLAVLSDPVTYDVALAGKLWQVSLDLVRIDDRLVGM